MPSATDRPVAHPQPLSPSQIPSNPPDLSKTTKLPKLTPRRRAPPSNPLPVPETPSLPPPPALETITFTKPTRRILSPEDHQLFLQSKTYTLVLSFVFSLSDSVRDTPVSAIKDAPTHSTVRNILDILNSAEEVLKRCPPVDQGGSRFGNKGFCRFLDELEKESEGWHREKLGLTDNAAIEEVSTYFLQSFGNRTRIDYGSGHELNFIVWLLTLYQLSLLPATTFPSLVLHVFTRYLGLMRQVQSTYYLEPAGSHGVWGLDDYQFLPFLFGASQLLHHAFITPLSIHNPLVLTDYASEYLYISQVAFVSSVKNVEGLRWHSPMLDDISAAKNWAKVEAGMRRMFVAEVLRKLPVMQHFLFGALVPAVDGMSTEDDFADVDADADAPSSSSANADGNPGVVVMQDGMRHVHQHSSWGDCCGIKVPSSLGAAQEMKKRMGGGAQALRRVPFD
ncbi:MAG: Serine/threonine-protein phosphatase 2A activator 2 [Sarea resinae]|nr:MAG: Serine/threonine-protein phosphatase 2A activator 2 [Sarea resinae]